MKIKELDLFAVGTRRENGTLTPHIIVRMIADDGMPVGEALREIASIHKGFVYKHLNVAQETVLIEMTNYRLLQNLYSFIESQLVERPEGETPGQKETIAVMQSKPSAADKDHKEETATHTAFYLGLVGALAYFVFVR